MTLRYKLIILLVPLIWGANMIAMRITLTELPPLLATFLRFAIVASILVPLVKRPTGKMLQVLTLAFTLGLGHFGLMTVAMQTLDASVGTVLLQLGVPFSSLLAAIFLNDRLGWRRLAGMVGAFVGVLVLFWDPTALMPPIPFIIIVFSTLFWAIGNIQIKRIGEIDIFSMNGWMALFSTPILLILTLALEQGQIEALTNSTWRSWAGLGFTICLSMFFANALWYWALKRFDVNQVVPATMLAPVVGMALGMAMLGEPLTWARVIGAVLVLAGVGVIILRRPAYADRKSGE